MDAETLSPEPMPAARPPIVDGTMQDFDAASELTAPEEKWGTALDGGFQVLPDLLLRRQCDLRLNTTDVVVLLHITMAWWEQNEPPYPRPSTIAKRMKASERTVQRSIDHLRKSGLLRKTTVRTAAGEKRTAFDLSPLAARLQGFAATDPRAERRRSLRVGGAGVQTQFLAQAQ